MISKVTFFLEDLLSLLPNFKIALSYPNGRGNCFPKSFLMLGFLLVFCASLGEILSPEEVGSDFFRANQGEKEG